MEENLIQALNLSKTEAKIYETLIGYEELTVTDIAVFSGVDRRNTYDTIRRLLEKGLVFEVKQNKESKYQAVHPKKLRDILKDRQLELDKVLPRMEHMYLDVARADAVFVYRGVEGWKNYIRDILKSKKDLYSLGAKGGWADERLLSQVKNFAKEAKKNGIKIHIIYDHPQTNDLADIQTVLGNNFRYLPAEYSSSSTVDIFDDNVVILSNIEFGKVDDKSSITVIKNKGVAEAFKLWFKFVWERADKKVS